MATGRFDDLTDVYEAMIDWPKRLANEEPFFHRLFDQTGARRVADVACGTGRHAAMFHGWGLQVDAADISPQMIAKAREQFGQPGGLTWSVRGFEEPIPAERPLDVVTCLGNSLALANDRATANAPWPAWSAPRSGGLVVIHLLNLWRLDDGPVHWQKCLVLTCRKESRWWSRASAASANGASSTWLSRRSPRPANFNESPPCSPSKWNRCGKPPSPPGRARCNSTATTTSNPTTGGQAST